MMTWVLVACLWFLISVPAGVFIGGLVAISSVEETEHGR